MTDTTAPEPTMEEILASIRRIISEDDAPAPAEAETAAPPAAAAAEPAPVETMVEAPSAPEPSTVEMHPAPREDVLELTERVEAPPVMAVAPEPAPIAVAPAPQTMGDLDFGGEPETAAAPEPPRAAAPSAAPAEPLVGQHAAARAADHFGALASSLAMPAAGRTLEDVVAELLRPLLKDWLDTHLPAIVEARVQDEVERISRRRTY